MATDESTGGVESNGRVFKDEEESADHAVRYLEKRGMGRYLERNGGVRFEVRLSNGCSVVLEQAKDCAGCRWVVRNVVNGEDSAFVTYVSFKDAFERMLVAVGSEMEIQHELMVALALKGRTVDGVYDEAVKYLERRRDEEEKSASSDSDLADVPKAVGKMRTELVRQVRTAK